MKIIDKFQKDKGFRNIVIGFIVIVLVMGNMNDDKKQAKTDAQCRQAGGITGNPPYKGSDFNACINEGCYPVTIQTGGFIDDGGSCVVGAIGKIFPSLDITYMTDCVAQVPNNIYYISTSGDNTVDACQSASGVKKGSFLCGADVYQCRFSSEPAKERKCATKFQRGAADILDSVWKENEMACKTKYYVVAFGGGFVGAMFLMAAI